MSLMTSQVTPLTEEELIEIGRNTSPLTQRLARMLFTTTGRLDFYRALSFYRQNSTREGPALVSFWNIITKRGQRTGLAHNPLSVIIPVLLFRMHDLGNRWQAAFRPWVPETDSMMFTASEHAGLTPSLIQTLIDITVEGTAWKDEISKALRVPFFNALSILGMLAAISLYFIPAFTQKVPHMHYVGRALALKNVSDFTVHFGVLIVLLLLALPTLVKRFLSTYTGPFRSYLDMLPGFSLYKEASGMTFLLGVAALLEAGAKFNEALSILKRYASPYARQRIGAIASHDDLKPAAAMDATGYEWPSDGTIQMLELYMAQEHPEQGIKIIVGDWFKQAAQKYARIGRLVNFITTLIIFYVFGWVYMAANDLLTAAAQAARSIN